MFCSECLILDDSEIMHDEKALDLRALMLYVMDGHFSQHMHSPQQLMPHQETGRFTDSFIKGVRNSLKLKRR